MVSEDETRAASLNRAFEANRKLWDNWTQIHVKSKYYDVEGFKRGACRLADVEIKEVGDVTGKSLLHLQCHFGLHTLSWARRGAEVVGIDFCERAIAQATELATELALSAKFVCCELSELPKHLTGQFDIVFTSGGVLAWLRDLAVWARVIAHFLKPGGVFYIRECHPFAGVLDDEQAPECPPRLRYPYFHSPEPMRFEGDSSYTDRDTEMDLPHCEGCEWCHSIGEIVTSLIEAGLRIEFLHEFDYSTHQSHPFLTKGRDGLWRYDKAPETLPLMFSLKAIKPLEKQRCGH